MVWLLCIGLQVIAFFVGVRLQRRAGVWSWSMFALAMGFMVLEVLMLTLPLFLGAAGNRDFVPIWTAAWVLAGLNLIWFLAMCRRVVWWANAGSWARSAVTPLHATSQADHHTAPDCE